MKGGIENQAVLMASISVAVNLSYTTAVATSTSSFISRATA